MITGTPVTPFTPEGGLTNTSWVVTLDSTGLTSDNPPLVFEVEWSADNFSSVMGSASITPDIVSQYQIQSLSAGTLYYARLKASDGDDVEYSGVHSDTTTSDFTGPSLQAAAALEAGTIIEVIADEGLIQLTAPGSPPYPDGFSLYTVGREIYNVTNSGATLLLHFDEPERILLGDDVGELSFNGAITTFTDINANPVQSNGNVNSGSVTNTSLATRPVLDSAETGAFAEIILTFTGNLQAGSLSLGGLVFNASGGSLTVLSASADGGPTVSILVSRPIVFGETITFDYDAAASAYSIKEAVYGAGWMDQDDVPVSNNEPETPASGLVFISSDIIF